MSWYITELIALRRVTACAHLAHTWMAVSVITVILGTPTSAELRGMPVDRAALRGWTRAHGSLKCR